MLVIEPDRDLRHELTEDLRRAGLIVVAARDEATGLVLVRRLDVRVVVVAVAVVDPPALARVRAQFGGGGRRTRRLIVLAGAGAPPAAPRRRGRADIVVVPRPVERPALRRLVKRAMRTRGRRFPLDGRSKAT